MAEQFLEQSFCWATVWYVSASRSRKWHNGGVSSFSLVWEKKGSSNFKFKQQPREQFSIVHTLADFKNDNKNVQNFATKLRVF